MKVSYLGKRKTRETKDRVIWLHLSLFFPETQFDVLIGNVIYPFFRKKLIHNNVKHYLLGFNEERGSNIRLSIGVGGRQFQEVATFTYNYFNNSPQFCNIEGENEESGKLGLLFLLFPPGGILYNLHRSNIISPEEELNDLLVYNAGVLSGIITRLIHEKSLSTMSLPLFSLFLYYIAFNVTEALSASGSPIPDFLCRDCGDIDTSDTKFTNEAFRKNKLYIQQNMAYLSGRRNSLGQAEEKWINEWHNACVITFNKYVQYIHDKEIHSPQQIFRELIFININYFLGLKPALQAYLLKRCRKFMA